MQLDLLYIVPRTVYSKLKTYYAMGSGKKALKILNIVVVFLFIIIPLLLSISYFAKNEMGIGMTFAGMFIVAGLLYWLYGVDFFEVSWLKKSKPDKT